MPIIPVPLAANWSGLDRLNAPQNLDVSKSPDCSDCRAHGKQTGKLGPRLGRQRTSSRPFPILGMGGFLADNGQRFRITAETDGTWAAARVPWPSPAAPTTPTTGYDVIHIVGISAAGTPGNTVYSSEYALVTPRNLSSYGKGLIFPVPSNGQYVYSAPVSSTPTNLDVVNSLGTLSFSDVHGLTVGQVIHVETDYLDEDVVVTGVPTTSQITFYQNTYINLSSTAVTGTVQNLGSPSLYDGTVTIEGKVSGVWADLGSQLTALTGSLTHIRLNITLSAVSPGLNLAVDFDVYLLGDENSAETIP